MPGLGLGIRNIGLRARHRLVRRRTIDRSRLAHRSSEPSKADCGEFADKPGQIAEVMRRRCVRNAGLTRHRAQGQPLQTVALQHDLGGPQQCLIEIAVMIRLLVADWRLCVPP